MMPARARLLPACLAALAILGCGGEREVGRTRRPVRIPPGQEWVRLALDADAQRAFPQVWLGNAKGQAVPFEVERDSLWTSRPMEVTRLSLGQDPQNRPTAELSLRLPLGWKPGERQFLRMDLVTEGYSPWVCAVRLQHKVDGQFLEMNPDAPFHVYDLGLQGSGRTLMVPWDATEYRLLFQPLQGITPRLRNVAVTAITSPVAPPREDRLAARVSVAPGQGTSGEVHTLSLPLPDRIGALELDLDPAPAPIKPTLNVAREPGKAARPDEPWPCTQLLWNMPREGSRCQRVEFPPVVARELRVGLPPGAPLKRIRLLPRRNVLIFRAEPGKTYYLHLRSAPPAAAGVCPLPDGSREVYAQEPLFPGAAEPDPHWISLPRIPDWREAARSRLAWGAGILLLAGGLVYVLRRRP